MPTPYRPTVADVAVFIRSRTKGKLTEEQNTFTADTIPTATQVEKFIDVSERHIARAVGEVPITLLPDAKDVVAVCAAAQIELSYFPEQIRTDKSPFIHLREQCQMMLAELAKAVDDLTGDGVIDGSELSLSPAAAFPEEYIDFGLDNRYFWPR